MTRTSNTSKKHTCIAAGSSISGSGSPDLKSFLIAFDEKTAAANFQFLNGPQFSASSVDDLLMLEEKDWERLAGPQALGNLPARRLRARLSKPTGAGSGGISITATSGGTIKAGAVGQYAKQIVKHYHGTKEQNMEPEPYDFSSIIHSKLSGIKSESFGREWLFDQINTRLVSPGHNAERVILITGEPVRDSGLR